MRADWTAEARAYIEKATKDLPSTATLPDRRRALRKVSCEFHGYTSWGQRVWSRECRRYLEQHGLPPIPPLGTGQSKQDIRLAAPDITFPFRSAT